MEIRIKIEKALIKALNKIGTEDATVSLEHPTEIFRGDYTTNVAMVMANRNDESPRELAEKIVAEMKKEDIKEISKIEVAGPGFINFYLSPRFLAESVFGIFESGERIGSNSQLFGEKLMIEYTNPNPFKDFHIGHLMTNSIGESLARLFEYSGAIVVRANYQGDVGPHVAKALWGMMQNIDKKPSEKTSLIENVRFIGECYVEGNKAYEKGGKNKEEIDKINKSVYERDGVELMELYGWGRAVSLDYFETLYKKLGTSFDHYFFESQTFQKGLDIVEKNLKEGVFENSDGAIIFRGEKYDKKLHTRVFVNSIGLPTYETKDLGLAVLKSEKEEGIDKSIIITGNEQKTYFDVMLKALSLLYPDLAEKTTHIYHGMLITPEGKMSSRKGNVMGGGTLLEDIEKVVLERIKEGGKFTSERQMKETSEKIALSAFRYSVLRQALGKNVVFDIDQALSFEGDSGPYLQYTSTRAKSVSEKARKAGIKPESASESPFVSELERLLYRFPDVVGRAQSEYAPHYVLTYLTSLASSFNGFYAQERISDPKDPNCGYKLLLVESFHKVMTSGLYLLGIEAPEKM